MPVMKQFRIGSATYDTVGEASVTQVQTSGTKIATVTIDGTATDLYAPEGGGGGPEPSSTSPAMDGTAAVGTATTYARADHVHPTDTSRQATLVSGTNIKTINNESLLGSGNITISGGGGGSSWTDISSGYAAGLIAANETDMFGQLDIVAYTNGQLVYLSGEISRTSVNTMTLPSGYEATGYAAGGALDLDSGAPATCYITSFTDYNGFDAVDANMEACEHFTFTIIYPIA